jgi:hypothetical protein
MSYAKECAKCGVGDHWTRECTKGGQVSGSALLAGSIGDYTMSAEKRKKIKLRPLSDSRRLRLQRLRDSLKRPCNDKTMCKGKSKNQVEP